MQASVVARREGFKSGFTGRPARPEEHDMRAGELHAEVGLQRGGQAVAIGVETAPARGRAAQGIDGADGDGVGIDLLDQVEGEHLVGHREVQAMEAGDV